MYNVCYIPSSYKLSLCDVGRDSSIGIASRYGLDGPGIESRWGARSSAPVHTDPGAQRRYRGIHGGKAAGGGVDHPPPSKAEVKERVDLYLFSPSGPFWPVQGWILLTLEWFTLKMEALQPLATRVATRMSRSTLPKTQEDFYLFHITTTVRTSNHVSRLQCMRFLWHQLDALIS
jgi:hypothetical protein